MRRTTFALAAAIVAATGGILHADDRKGTLDFERGEVLVAPVAPGVPGVYVVHAYLASGRQPGQAYDTFGFVNGRSLTFTVMVEHGTMVGALAGHERSRTPRTYTIQLGEGDVPGRWRIRNSTPSAVRVAAPPAGADPTVALAMSLTDEQADRAREVVRQRFGVTPRRWLGYLAPPDSDELLPALRAAAARSRGRISPLWLHTVAIGEGLNLYLDSDPSSWIGDQRFPVNGFAYLGVDTFGSRAAALRAGGYIPQDFREGVDYEIVSNVNEHGQTVRSANFRNLEAGLTALQGMLAQSEDAVLADVRSIWGPNTRLTPDQLRFWSYFDFNVGSGRRREFMRAHPPSWGDRRDGPEREDQREARYNALVRVATARWLEDVGAFRDPPPAPPAAAAAAPSGVVATATSYLRPIADFLNSALGD